MEGEGHGNRAGPQTKLSFRENLIDVIDSQSIILQKMIADIFNDSCHNNFYYLSSCIGANLRHPCRLEETRPACVAFCLNFTIILVDFGWNSYPFQMLCLKRFL